jgi:quercetin dioxygenase-like cupin family protein
VRCGDSRQNEDDHGQEAITMKWLLAAVLISAAVPAFAQDALAVNPSTIRLKLENEKVRVLEATLPPGHKETMHSHPANVIYVIRGGKIRSHSADGKMTVAELKTGEVIYRDPLTHWAENIGKAPIHLILVELKK